MYKEPQEDLKGEGHESWPQNRGEEAQPKANTYYSRLPTICIDNQELTVSHWFLAFG